MSAHLHGNEKYMWLTWLYLLPWYVDKECPEMLNNRLYVYHFYLLNLFFHCSDFQFCSHFLFFLHPVEGCLVILVSGLEKRYVWVCRVFVFFPHRATFSGFVSKVICGLLIGVAFDTHFFFLCSQIIGNLLYYRYMNPAIVAPDAFDIIDLSAGGQLTTDQRRNLGSIAKMLQHAASNKMFLGDNAHLSIINEYLSQSYQKFR